MYSFSKGSGNSTESFKPVSQMDIKSYLKREL